MAFVCLFVCLFVSSAWFFVRLSPVSRYDKEINALFNCRPDGHGVSQFVFIPVVCVRQSLTTIALRHCKLFKA